MAQRLPGMHAVRLGYVPPFVSAAGCRFAHVTIFILPKVFSFCNRRSAAVCPSKRRIFLSQLLHPLLARAPSSAPSFLLPPAMLFSFLPPLYSPSRHPASIPYNTIPFAPSFSIPPSCTYTIYLYPHRTVFRHPLVPHLHRTSPSPPPHPSPSRYPAPAPYISILSAPFFSILPSRTYTIYLHSLRSFFLHLATPCPHHRSPSPSHRLSPSCHHVPAPYIPIPAAPSFTILRSCTRTIHLHPRRTVFYLPPVLHLHHITPSPPPPLSPSSRPAPTPYISILLHHPSPSLFPPILPAKKKNRKNFKKMQKRC